jgi:uncharacterized protein (DUF924 family)
MDKRFMQNNYQIILDFWFKEIEPKQWWVKSAAFDQLIVQRFAGIHRQAQQGELFLWRTEPLGRLAEIIILDQFSRNMFRDTPYAFASDPMALTLTQEAIQVKADTYLTPDEKGFLYMPMMHSESLLIHTYAQPFFAQDGCESYARSAKQHLEVIQRFGRYPHRNVILGRVCSVAEMEFLAQPGSTF